MPERGKAPERERGRRPLAAHVSACPEVSGARTRASLRLATPFFHSKGHTLEFVSVSTSARLAQIAQ